MIEYKNKSRFALRMQHKLSSILGAGFRDELLSSLVKEFNDSTKPLICNKININGKEYICFTTECEDLKEKRVHTFIIIKQMYDVLNISYYKTDFYENIL